MKVYQVKAELEELIRNGHSNAIVCKPIINGAKRSDSDNLTKITDLQLLCQYQGKRLTSEKVILHFEQH